MFEASNINKKKRKKNGRNIFQIQEKII